MAAPPFLPFARPTLDRATIEAVSEVLASGWITTGPRAAEFEAALSGLFGGRPVRAFANGTATMETALRLAGIGPGDEVITTPLTWVATANVIVAVGATPVFVDIDPVTRNIDLAAMESAITDRTRALMPVHLAGLPVDMDRLYDIAARRRLRVIEDAAQAIGSRWGERLVGSIGDLVSFSFQANKNITCAEGGCLVLNDGGEARQAELLRLQGVVRTGMDEMDVVTPGGKSNLGDINAIIGLLPASASRRHHATAGSPRRQVLRECAATSSGGPGHPVPPAANVVGAITNWHMFQVMLPTSAPVGDRARVMRLLRDAGIGTGVHYPALHLFSYYRRSGWREGMLPNAEAAGRALLTLPLFPAMDDADVDRVCAALADVCKGGAA